MKNYSLEELRLISEFLKEQSSWYNQRKWEVFHEARGEEFPYIRVQLEALEDYYGKKEVSYFSAHKDVELLINDKRK